VFAAERVRVPGPELPTVGAGRRCGLIDDATRDAVLADGWARVIAPALAELLG
jgi:hypothetical protein